MSPIRINSPRTLVTVSPAVNSTMLIVIRGRIMNIANRALHDRRIYQESEGENLLL